MKNDNSIVISSRIRLARNIIDLPFPYLLEEQKALDIINGVYSAVAKVDNFLIHKMSIINPVDGLALREKRLISTDLLKNNVTGAAIINESETISIMINEEDHIREQCILKGLQLQKASSIINKIDDNISKRYNFAYSHKLGYLTACPTNLGTGMRASAMMFLPGLSIYRSLDACVNAITRLNMTIRGVYGEGSESVGYVFQVSNQKTLGINEEEIIDAVEMSVGHITDAELKARALLISTGGAELKDRILRAYGVLTNAYKISVSEFMQLSALIKLGTYYEFINISDSQRLETIITNAQQASLLTMSSTELTAEECDIYRAQYVSKNLKAITKSLK